MYFLTRHPVFLKKNKKIVTFLNIFLDGVKKCARLKECVKNKRIGVVVDRNPYADDTFVFQS